jgi:hypothetical protein
MKRLLAGIFMVAAVISLAAMTGAAGAEEYQKYCNARFGFCVEYPARLTMEPPPVNDDGRVFTDGQGLRLTASGINNVMEETLANARLSQEREFDRVSYRSGGSNWYVLSGYKGDKIIYLKTFVGRGSINHLYISYHACKKAEYEEMVTRVARSLVPGELEEGH